MWFDSFCKGRNAFLVDKMDVHIRQIVARTVFLLSSTACLSKGN